MTKSAQCWINDSWVRFTLRYGIYTNIITFLDDHGLSFIKTNKIDFSNVPLYLHGYGTSENLVDYLSHNEGNTRLIQDFIEYFLYSLHFQYLDGREVVYTFERSTDWQTSNVIVPIEHLRVFSVDTTLFRVDTTYITADKTSY